MSLIDLILETRGESGKGSPTGRGKMLSGSKTKKAHSVASKSRVKVYNSITDALAKGYVGQIFSTKNADRLYVITKQKWGKDDEQMVGGRTAKGFSPGSIPASFRDVKRYSVRTMQRHGTSRSKHFRDKQFWKAKFRGKGDK